MVARVGTGAVVARGGTGSGAKGKDGGGDGKWRGGAVVARGWTGGGGKGRDGGGGG